MNRKEGDKNGVRILFVNSNPFYKLENHYYSIFSWVRFPEFVAQKIGFASLLAPVISVPEGREAPVDSFEIVAPRLRVEGSQYYSSLAAYLKLLPTNYFAWKSQIRRLVDEHDIVVHRIPSPNFSLVARESRRAGKPFFVMVAGDVSQQAEPLFGTNRIRRFAYSLVASWLLGRQVRIARTAAKIYAFNGDLRKRFEKANANTVLYRTPIISRSQIHRKSVCNIETPVRLVRVCWLMRSKGLEYLIEAVSLLKQRGRQVRLTIVGKERQAGYLSELIELATKLEVNDEISFPGWVPHDQIESVYQASDIHVMSSLAEGMPRSILESAASGCPQVCTRVGGCIDYLTNERDAILVPAANSEALAQGIEKVIENTVLRERLIENGFSLAEEACFENAGVMLLNDIANVIEGKELATSV